MAVIYYDVLLFLSFMLTVVYAYIWRKRFDVRFTLIFTIIPMADVGYVFIAHSKTLGEALIGNNIVYFGGCFLPLFIMMSVFNLCDVKLPKIVNTLLILISFIVYSSTLTIGKNPVFYTKADISTIYGGTVIVNKEYGFMHTVFYVMVILYFLAGIVVSVYTYIRKKTVSKRIVQLLFVPVTLSMLAFFLGRLVIEGLELVPIAYLIAQIVYLMIVDRMYLYDVSDTVIDSLVQTNETGLVSIDLKRKYLGCNDVALSVFPELSELTVDRSFGRNGKLRDTLLLWLDEFLADESKDKHNYEKDGKIFLIDINYLYQGSRKRGYQFVITDDTKNQKYISLINKYNTALTNEVAEKTKSLVEMHDKLILGMAAMVESRDNSTGGHIRRTSDVVKMLVDEIKKDNKLGLDDEFCKDLIKAAPMHDLGKIAVDDAILRKPGRFTDEEFEVMKTHAAEGARIVHQILEGTDDIDFHIIAENVAHYHHERWDGSGYPEGLKGEEIPIEARIMAIADVYDALVSKRVYKESMPFDKADAIIMDGMGKHFDKNLEKYYVSARPRLEEYYRMSD